jgi:hypothetical protein
MVCVVFFRPTNISLEGTLCCNDFFAVSAAKDIAEFQANLKDQVWRITMNGTSQKNRKPSFLGSSAQLQP